MVIRVDIDDEEKQVSGVDWSLSWERVGRGWDWRGERRFPSKIAKAKTMILQNSAQRKTQVNTCKRSKEVTGHGQQTLGWAQMMELCMQQTNAATETDSSKTAQEHRR